MDRRGFLRGLFGAGAALAVGEIDVDKLLWTPGRKVISIPKPIAIKTITTEMMANAMLSQLNKNLVFARLLNHDYEDAFLRSIRDQSEMVVLKKGDIVNLQPQYLDRYVIVGHCQSGVTMELSYA